MEIESFVSYLYACILIVSATIEELLSGCRFEWISILCQGLKSPTFLRGPVFTKQASTSQIGALESLLWLPFSVKLNIITQSLALK